MASRPLPSSNFITRLSSPHTHTAADLVHFENTPWCQEIINSPASTPIPTPSLDPKLTSEDSLFATIVRGNQTKYRETIHSCIAYRRHHKQRLAKKTPSEGSIGGGIAEAIQGKTLKSKYDGIIMMMSLGSGMDGHEGILHGGFIAMILDEALGMAGGLYTNKSSFTASLKVDYRIPVSTPGIILVKGRIVRQEGRKSWVKGSVEDGRGLIYAEGEGLFLEFREQNL